MPCSVLSGTVREQVTFSVLQYRRRKPIETSYLFRTQNNSRNSTWNCNLLNMILRNPIYTLTISLKPIKDMQQHTVFPSCAKYLYITE